MCRNMGRLVVGLVLAALGAAMVGCGGSGAGARGAGTLAITVEFPPRSAAPAAILAATNSFLIRVTDPATSAPLTPDKVVARSAGDTQTVRISGLRPGGAKVEAFAYESNDATGEAIARASALLDVVAGVNTPVHLALGALPHHVGLTPAPLRLEKGTTAGLTANVYDADGNILLGTFAFDWATSASAVATVDDAGNVTAVGVGTADVTVALSGTAKHATCSVEVWRRNPIFVVFGSPHYRGSEDDAYFRAAFAAMCAEPDVSFLVGLGDITDRGTVDEMQKFKALLDETGKPWHLIKGDHENFVSATTWDGVFGPSNWTFTEGAVTFMGVDSTNGTGGVTNVVIPPETLSWVGANLPARTAPLVVFTHFPLIDAGKPASETVWWQRGRPLNADAMLNLFAGRALMRVFCDHWRADVQDTATRPGTIISTGWSSSPWKSNHDGDPRKGYYVCGYADGAVKVEFRAFDVAVP
jgi:hypothetical protein